jgi:hypothetical protein
VIREETSFSTFSMLIPQLPLPSAWRHENASVSVEAAIVRDQCCVLALAKVGVAVSFGRALIRTKAIRQAPCLI